MPQKLPAIYLLENTFAMLTSICICANVDRQLIGVGIAFKVMKVKRETGENPVRTRHCNQIVFNHGNDAKSLPVTVKMGRRLEMRSCKSGNLPIEVDNVATSNWHNVTK